MRYIVIIILMVMSRVGFAQDPQLFENTWYLQKVVIDDIDYFPPYSQFRGELDLTIETIVVSHPQCEEGFGTNIYYTEPNIFNIDDTSVVLIGSCVDQDVISFMDRHYSIYLLDNAFAKNPFTYILTTNNDNAILIISNVDGDKAIYGDVLLSNLEYNLSSIFVYPNPVNNILRLDYKSNIEITSLKIYDYLGRLVLEEKKKFDQIDVSNLNSGVLFVKIETDLRVVTKKIIKN